jgi:hypothetical protein
VLQLAAFAAVLAAKQGASLITGVDRAIRLHAFDRRHDLSMFAQTPQGFRRGG